MNINVGDEFPLILRDSEGNLWRMDIRDGVWNCQCDGCSSCDDRLRERCHLSDLIREYGPVSVP